MLFAYFQSITSLHHSAFVSRTAPQGEVVKDSDFDDNIFLLSTKMLLFLKYLNNCLKLLNVTSMLQIQIVIYFYPLVFTGFLPCDGSTLPSGFQNH